MNDYMKYINNKLEDGAKNNLPPEPIPPENIHRTWSIVRYHYDEDRTRHEEVVYEHYAITPSSSDVYDSVMRRERIINIVALIAIIIILLFGLAIMFIYLKWFLFLTSWSVKYDFYFYTFWITWKKFIEHETIFSSIWIQSNR